MESGTTYIETSLKNGHLMRWTFMPLKVYISPMKFYSKQGQDYKYRSLVRQALSAWEKASNGKISFKIVPTLLESNINIEWKRVERKALGYCTFQTDSNNRLYSAEVQIGLTEGLVHADYMDEGEVYHTILHEIGHALGLGHSPYKTDIMYTPHQKGINKLSANDILTLKWLYILPQGATPKEIGTKYGAAGSSIDEIVTKVRKKQNKSEFEQVKNNIPQKPERNLEEEQERLAMIRKHHMALQNITLPENVRLELLKGKNKRNIK